MTDPVRDPVPVTVRDPGPDTDPYTDTDPDTDPVPVTGRDPGPDTDTDPDTSFSNFALVVWRFFEKPFYEQRRAQDAIADQGLKILDLVTALIFYLYFCDKEWLNQMLMPLYLFFGLAGSVLTAIDGSYHKNLDVFSSLFFFHQVLDTLSASGGVPKEVARGAAALAAAAPILDAFLISMRGISLKQVEQNWDDNPLLYLLNPSHWDKGEPTLNNGVTATTKLCCTFDTLHRALVALGYALPPSAPFVRGGPTTIRTLRHLGFFVDKPKAGASDLTKPLTTPDDCAIDINS